MSVNLGWGHRASSQWVKSRKSMADVRLLPALALPYCTLLCTKSGTQGAEHMSSISTGRAQATRQDKAAACSAHGIFVPRFFVNVLQMGKVGATAQYLMCCNAMQMIQGVSNATVRDMDLWSISLTSGLPDQHQQNALQSPHPNQQNGKDEDSKRRCDIPLRDQAPFIDDELPAAMHAQHDSGMQGSKRAGKFTYYFTVGLDAEAAYRCAWLTNAGQTAKCCCLLSEGLRLTSMSSGNCLHKVQLYLVRMRAAAADCCMKRPCKTNLCLTYVCMLEAGQSAAVTKLFAA